MGISRKKIGTGLAVAGLAAGAALAAPAPAEAASGYTVSNICGNWAGANHAVTMQNYWGGWDLVPCGHTYLNIVKVYYGGPGYLKLEEYPNTCFPTGSTAFVTRNSGAWTTAGC